jgi:hypothetical protein
MSKVKIRPSPAKVAVAFVAIALVIVCIDLVTQAARYYSFEFPLRLRIDRLFHVGREANIPAWFSSAMLLVAAALLGFISYLKFAQRDRYRALWLILSVIFIYLSADETAVIHEEVGSLLGAQFPDSVFRYGWLALGVVAVVLLVIGYLRFVVALPATTRWLFVLAATLFVGGAIIVESLAWPYENGRAPDFSFATLVAVEEFMEMTGVIVFIYALLSYIYVALGHTEIVVTDPKPAQ